MSSDEQQLTAADIAALENHGIPREEADRQLKLFRNPPGFTRIERACTPGDGIRRLSESDRSAALEAHESAGRANRLIKLVPASGAATRMFQSLLRFRNDPSDYGRQESEERASGGDDGFADLIRFVDGTERFAFATLLREAMESRGDSLVEAVEQFAYRPILEALLAGDALGFAALPKGLIPFHTYSGVNRTPFEEHLVEAALYGKNGDQTCSLHFTVSPEHRSRFETLLDRATGVLSTRFGIHYDVSFSEQKSSTDTVAVDPENRLFRDEGDSPLFRPGGHGALIENLNDLQGDLIFIKNIDNVSPTQLGEDCVQWKKLLGGHAARLQSEAFRHLATLEQENSGAPGRRSVEDAARFLRDELSIQLPLEIDDNALPELRKRMISLIRRPLRVCGMVRNEGEPGGGPFWVRDGNDNVSIQIVESAQIDVGDPAQKAVLDNATHFNPVDLVCAVRDPEGNPYDLRKFVDSEAVFISRKSKDGRELKALERPGLWNGAMAYWNTVFVEVPPETFSPVKKVMDLLDLVHQE